MMIALHRRVPVSLCVALLLAACRAPGGDAAAGRAGAGQALAEQNDEPPVALNAESPVTLPPALLARGIEGTVLLHLFVDERGQLHGDSTRLAESSGYPALDSAALAAAPRLRYAPALRGGAPVAAHFIQPIEFRQPHSGAGL